MAGLITAVENGRSLEEDFVSLLVSFGFRYMKYRDFQKLYDKNGRFVLADVPYTTIYGMNGRSEYLIHYISDGLKHRVECKEQNVAGSVDEKLPYLMANCLEAFPEKNIIVIHRGSGFKTGAIPWLKKKAKENSHIKNIQVFDLPEFRSFISGVVGKR